jgi:hypothetical protein
VGSSPAKTCRSPVVAAGKRKTGREERGESGRTGVGAGERGGGERRTRAADGEEEERGGVGVGAETGEGSRRRPGAGAEVGERRREEGEKERRRQQACVLFIIRPGPRRGLTIPFRSVWEGGEGGREAMLCPFRLGRPGARSHRTRVAFGVLDPLVRSYRGRDRGGQLHANANDSHVDSCS